MSEYTTEIVWNRDGAAFSDGRYSRGHRWLFDGGIEVPGSSSPHVVPAPMSVAEAVDPEEAFVVSLSSCHMLSFLYVAQRKGFIVEAYRDQAVGLLETVEHGKMSMTVVTLRPAVSFAGEQLPTKEEIETMHHEAHDLCFIARSVKTDVRCEPAR